MKELMTTQIVTSKNSAAIHIKINYLIT